MPKCVAVYHPFREIDYGDAWTNDKRTWQHGRKYIYAFGSCIDGLEEQPHRAMLYFWAEYEAPTIASDINQPKSDKIFPRVLHHIEKNVPINRTVEPWQNTDPFVFNGPFIYSNCRQDNRILRELDRGDILLFVSRHKSRYYLDTVLVIHRIYDPIPFSAGTWCRTYRGCEAFERVTGRQIDYYYKYEKKEWVTYTGRTFGKEPFSYVPCWRTSPDEGHPRMEIQLQDLESDTRRQFKILSGNPKEIWNQVAQQVINAGGSLAVYVDHPLKDNNSKDEGSRSAFPSC